jgi:lysyl-tRNA synthetase class 2
LKKNTENEIDILKARADLLRQLRLFFENEKVLEVDTPLLYPFTSPDPFIQHLSIDLPQGRSYLQSSPEFAMKRILSRVPVSIYQICKAFRAFEEGSRHRSEFTMIEWYMVDYSLEQLMEQCELLLKSLLEFKSVKKISYRETFLKAFDVDPFKVGIDGLREILRNHTSAVNLESFSFDECLHLLFSEKVESGFDLNCLTFVYDFPASQAALAQLAEDEFGNKVAKRFEIYLSGLELANAYQEEASVKVLEDRFKNENNLRKAEGKEVIPIDYSMFEDMEKAFPSCSGIAMGLERLLMIKLNKPSIDELFLFQT